MKDRQLFKLKTKSLELSQTYTRLIYSTHDNLATLLEYNLAKTDKFSDPDYMKKNYQRICREFLIGTKMALVQMDLIAKYLPRKYKQKLLDSSEIKKFLENLMEVEGDGFWAFGGQASIDLYRYKQESMVRDGLRKGIDKIMHVVNPSDKPLYGGIDNYSFVLNFFYVILEILVNKAPKTIRNKLVEALNEFITLNNIPLELGMTSSIKIEPVKLELDKTTSRVKIEKI